MHQVNSIHECLQKFTMSHYSYERSSYGVPYQPGHRGYTYSYGNVGGIRPFSTMPVSLFFLPLSL